jgi:hypothetical protein
MTDRTDGTMANSLALKGTPLSDEGISSLVELALDLRWSCNHASDEVWRRLDPVLWELTHNPWGSPADSLSGADRARASRSRIPREGG